MKHGHINGLSYPAAYYLQITTSCYTEVLTFDLFNYIKNHNIWYLSGAFPAVNQALPGRWIDLSLAWMHSRTLHRAHTWKIIHIHGSLSPLSWQEVCQDSWAHNILLMKKIRKQTSVCDTKPFLPPSWGSVTACIAWTVCPFFSCRVQV